MEYVALETRPECLIADLPGLQNPVVTDSDIFICSGLNIFRFGRDGKFLNRIGHGGRGPGEFLSATQMCVNATTEEVFVYDILSKGILVYNYDGRHKRTLRTSNNTIINDMAAINDSILLIANKSNDHTKDFAIYPFQLISSRDASVECSLLPPYKEPNAMVIIADPQGYIDEVRSGAGAVNDTEGFKGGGGMMMILMDGSPVQINDSNNIYNTGNGVMLTNYVADTVYVVSAAGELTPRWVKAPSPMELSIEKRRYSSLRLENGRYAFFYATAGVTGNMGYKVDKSTGDVTRTYLYDANIDHERTAMNRIISPTGVSTGRFAMPYQPLRLLHWLEKGKLTGELATLAATLKETANPVLMISKTNNGY